MKKIIALFLSLVMLLGLAMPAVAAEAEQHEKNPIIFIAGSSINLFDSEGNPLGSGFDIFTNANSSEVTKEKIIETSLNILIPFFFGGIKDNAWEKYGDALYEELAPLWQEAALDTNGNAKPGTGTSAAELAKSEAQAKVNAGADGYFGARDYNFIYDWRLSPYDEVDRLHAYIEEVKAVTGCDQVSLFGRCLGGGIITAYLEKYGHTGNIKKVLYDRVLVNGCSAISDCFSGKIDFSDKHAQAYITETTFFDGEGLASDFEKLNKLAIDFVNDAVNLLTQLGVLGTALEEVENLYYRLYSEFMPALLLATGMATWPHYWCSVYEEDFDTALNLVFGEEGSEKRDEYAPLIEKIEYIREHMIADKEELYTKITDEYGVEVGVISGYGLADAPITEHYDETGDSLVGLADASFGATTAGLFDALPDTYIEEKVTAGYGEYISPDNKVDASTCMFPETTWIAKNMHHDVAYFASVYIAEYFTQYSNVTVNSNSRGISRFLVYDETAPNEIVNMTEENCADGIWLNEVAQNPGLFSKLAALIRLLTTILRILTQIIRGTAIV